MGSAMAGDSGNHRGRQFVGLNGLNQFEQSSEGHFISPKIHAGISWDQLIVSWNFVGPDDAGLIIEARVQLSDHESNWYTLGKWTKAAGDTRESVKEQKDIDGRVDTDTLILKQPAKSVQLRIRLQGADAKKEMLKFLGLSFCDSSAEPEILPPNKAAWGKTLTVKERSQANYPEGITAWCSPTSTSMLLSYWAAKLDRPGMDYDVPIVAAAVNDPNWPGTGNWPFNTAFAGSHPGMRAYVTRFSDVSEIEDWTAAGFPVALSVRYNLLKGKTEQGNGHLVVCIGFTPEGDVVVNDPGRSHVRQTYKRENLIRAWSDSKQTVYLMYPEEAKIPGDRFGHWYSSPH